MLSDCEKISIPTFFKGFYPTQSTFTLAFTQIFIFRPTFIRAICQELFQTHGFQQKKVQELYFIVGFGELFSGPFLPTQKKNSNATFECQS